MRRSLGFALGLAVSAAVAAPAQADTVTVAGLDTLVWDKPTVDIKPGDSVVWTFPGTTQFHNVWSENTPTTTPWPTELRSPLGAPAPDTQPYTFEAEGTYNFFCQVHPDTMRGVVRVGAAAATPVVVPLSQQPLDNNEGAAVPLETNVRVDSSKPGLSSVSARRVSKGAARVRFKVSEASDVSVAFKRGGRTVKSATASGSGSRSVTVRGLRAGRYTIQVRATDIAGNRSKLRTLTLTVR